MAKIKITESELKQVIMENVLGVLKEGMQENQASRFQKRYNAYNQAVQNYNTEFAKDWSEMTEPEKAYWAQQAQADFDKNKMKDATTPPPNPENFYNKQREMAQAGTQRFLNKRGVGNIMQKQLQTAQANAEKYMGQLNTINKKLTDALSTFKINEVTDRAPETNPETNTPAAPDIATMEANIDKLVAHITNLNGELNKAKTNYTALQKRYTNLATTYNKTIQAQKNQAMAQQGQAKIQTQPVPKPTPLGNPNPVQAPDPTTNA